MNYLSNEVIAEFFTPLAENEGSSSSTTNVNAPDTVASSADSSTASSEAKEQFLREKYLKQKRDYKLEINRGFDAVNRRIPFLPEKNVPQIKTLRLSIGYIRHLERILADEMITDKNGVHRLLTIEDFEENVKYEMKRTDDHAGKAKEAIQMEEDMLTPPAKKPCLIGNAGFISPPVFMTPSRVHWTPILVPQAFDFFGQFNPTVTNPFLTPPQTSPSPAEQKPRNMNNAGISPPFINHPPFSNWTAAAVHQWFNYWSQFSQLTANSLMANPSITPPQTPSGTPSRPVKPSHTHPSSADKPPSQNDSSLVFMNL